MSAKPRQAVTSLPDAQSVAHIHLKEGFDPSLVGRALAEAPLRKRTAPKVTADEVNNLLDELSDTMETAVDLIRHEDKINAERNAELAQAQSEVLGLRAQLDAAERILSELKERGTVHREVVQHAATMEQRIGQAANAVYQYAQGRMVEKEFGADVNWSEIPQSCRDRITFLMNRVGVKSLIYNFASLYKFQPEAVTNEQLDAALDRIHAASVQIQEVFLKQGGVTEPAAVEEQPEPATEPAE